MEGSSSFQEERGAHPRRIRRPRWPLRRLRSPPSPALCLAPALPRTWSPVKFRRLRGTRVGKPTLHRPHVTMETVANGSHALPAGAEPSAARARGVGPNCQRTEGGAQITLGLTGRSPGHSVQLSGPGSFANIWAAFP